MRKNILIVKNLSILAILLLIIMGFTGCNSSNSQPTINSQNPQNLTTPFPPPVTTIPPPKTDWQKGSPPPSGIGGWPGPRILTDAEKTKVTQIAITSSKALAWLKGRTDYHTTSVYWIAIVWKDGHPDSIWSIAYNDQNNLQYVSPYAYWYPATSLVIGQDNLSIDVDLDSSLVAFSQAPPAPENIPISVPPPPKST